MSYDTGNVDRLLHLRDMPSSKDSHPRQRQENETLTTYAEMPRKDYTDARFELEEYKAQFTGYGYNNA